MTDLSRGIGQIHWYYSYNLKPRGPLTLAEMMTKIKKGEISLNSLIQKETERDWAPARSYQEFAPELFPANQNVTWPVDFISRMWILLMPQKEPGKYEQKGPYSVHEILEMKVSGVINKDCYIWKQGLSGWALIGERPEFAPSLQAGSLRSQDRS